MEVAAPRFKIIIGVAQLITVLSSAVGVAIPLVLKQAIDGRQTTGFRMELALLVLFLVQAIMESTGSFLMARAGEARVLATRSRITHHLLFANKSFFDHQVGDDLASHIVADTNTIREFLTQNVTLFVAGIVTIVGSVTALIILDWRLSLVMIAALPLAVLVITPISNVSEKYAKLMQDGVAQATSGLAESFRTIELVKANTAEATTNHRLDHNFKRLYRLSLRTDLMDAISSPTVLLLLFGAVAVIFLYGGQRVAAGTLSVGTLMSFLVYVFQLLNPLGGLSTFFASYARMKGATAKLNTLENVALEDTGGDAQLTPGPLAFRDVTFSYDGQRPILNDVTLNIPLNKKVAIVGPSGGGKSTIVDLIERFYPVNTGTIAYDDRNVTAYNLTKWRQAFALVSQDNNIIAGTIRDNLTFGLERSVTDDALKTALKQAGLLAEVTAFPDGLNTDVGENGTLLSGGQKQRIQIARAYLKNAQYIIFDEATANLDADAEHQVSASLNQLLTNRTAIIVAHRLSTIVDADIIYFLENHHITGCGTHDQLMATHATYRRFVNEQIIHVQKQAKETP